MAQEKDTSKQTASKQAEKTEQKFTVQTLRENCVKLFGCTSSTFDGAFFEKEDKEYTVSEEKEIIKNWLRKEVK